MVTRRTGSSRRSIARLLRDMNSEVDREVNKALYVAGELMSVEAQISITTGAVSGKNHVPSSPGQPPNNDTGHLANQIETNLVRKLEVEVSSNAEYSMALEFGNSRVAARPFMAPAANEKRGKAVRLVELAVKRALRNAAARSA